MLNIAIVEDEISAAEKLKEYLDRYGDENNVSFRVVLFSNVINLLTNYTPNYDIIFMDIELPHMNGMEGSRKLRKLDENVTIIFVTNMAQYAVQGYEVNAFDFIVKPLSYCDFSVKIRKALGKIRLSDEAALVVPVEGGLKKIIVSRIRYIDVMKHQVTLHTEDGDYKLYGTLKNLEEKLPPDRFSRCSSSYLVNLRYVDRIEEYQVYVGNDILPISRARKKEFMQALNHYLTGVI